MQAFVSWTPVLEGIFLLLAAGLRLTGATKWGGGGEGSVCEVDSDACSNDQAGGGCGQGRG